MDLSGAALSQDAAGKQTVAALRLEAQDAYDTAQNELLGPEGHRHLQEYVRTLPLRNAVVTGIDGVAALEGVPLSRDQAEALFRAAVVATGHNANLGGSDLAAAVDWGLLDVEAQRILTPAQFALFKSVSPLSGFKSRWELQLDAAIRHAAEAERSDVMGSAVKQ